MQIRKATNMSDEKFVLAIDEGTTSARAIIFNHAGQIMACLLYTSDAADE